MEKRFTIIGRNYIPPTARISQQGLITSQVSVTTAPPANQALNEEESDYSNHGTYGSLLFDPRWRERRTVILERDGYKCVVCGDPDKLQVHHRQYHIVEATGKFKPPWDYPDTLLITLCEKCHGRGHSKYKVPSIKV